MGFAEREDALRCPQCLRYYDKGIRSCGWCGVRLRRPDAVEDEEEAGTEAEHVALREAQEAQEAQAAAAPEPPAPADPVPPLAEPGPQERRSRRER